MIKPVRQQWAYYPKGETATSALPAHEVINSRQDLMRTLSHEDEFGTREAERWRMVGSDRCLTWEEVQKMIDSTRPPLKAILRLSNYQPNEY